MIAKVILENQNKVGEFTFPDVKTFYETTIVDSVGLVQG